MCAHAVEPRDLQACSALRPDQLGGRALHAMLGHDLSCKMLADEQVGPTASRGVAFHRLAELDDDVAWRAVAVFHDGGELWLLTRRG